MYKIVHGLAPDYLNNLLPPTVAARNPYHVRLNDRFSKYACRTEAFRDSFFPKTVNEWNELPKEVKHAPSLESFKGAVYPKGTPK